MGGTGVALAPGDALKDEAQAPPGHRKRAGDLQDGSSSAFVEVANKSRQRRDRLKPPKAAPAKKPEPPPEAPRRQRGQS